MSISIASKAALGRVVLYLFVALTAASGAHGQPARQAEYPMRVVRWVVPFTPGASNDVVARLIAARLTDTWGQQVVIDNRAGAGGLVGGEIVARSNADGYTMLLANPSSNAINFALRSQTPYKPEDFAAVVLLGWSPIMLVTSSTFPAAGVKDIIAAAKAKPGQLSGGSSGTGGSSHLALELFKMQAGVNILHVPYKGAAPAITDMIGGQLSLIFTTSVTAQPLITGGKLKALAVAGNKRLAVNPDVPTTAEQGLPAFDVLIWFGAAVPSATPRAVVQKLNRDMNAILQLADVKERFAALGLDPQGGTPERFAALMREDTERWSKVIKAANVRSD